MNNRVSPPAGHEEPQSGPRHASPRPTVSQRLRTYLLGPYVGRHGRRRPLFPGTYQGRHRLPPTTEPSTAPLERRPIATDLPESAGPSLADSVRAGGLAVSLLAATWVTQRPLAQWLGSNPDLNLYVAQPIWTFFAVVALRLYRRLGDAPPSSRVLTRIAFLAGVFHLSVVMLSGLLFEFGDNPSAGVLSNYPKNAFYYTTLVIGVETNRAFVFHALRRFGEMRAFLVTVPLFAAIAIPIGQWDLITDLDGLFRIGVGRYLPALTLSAVATSLVAGGGLFVSAAYRWPVLTLNWLVPILPGYDWPVRALVNTALPIASLVIARTLYEGTAEFAERYGEIIEDEVEPERHRRRAGWITTGVLALLIVLFVNGAFGVRPYLLSGISMEPAFQRGDVVIVREVPIESLEVNDVIRFNQSSSEFVHRIVEILDDEGEPVFLTKGDNVDRPDPLVTADRITGKVVFVLPKIGLPSLWIRETLDDR